MGCTGSRPSQLLPSLGSHHHHTNSPQKGFILFNAKTIEYLQANELEIKDKLKKRCEKKITKVFPQSTSSKSLLNNAKRTLLFNTSTSTNESVVPEENLATKSDASLPLNGPIKNELKLSAIDSAVDYVLKYALNDFDIENFKSSNHLSMKQIRKDIMKKNQSVSSLSKMNNLISVNTNSTATTNNTGTLPSHQAKSATLSKGHEASFYKQALNAAIDEFCLFVQENFIIINEFDKTNSSEVTDIKSVVIDKSDETDISVDPETEALKLKEALEVARHNFYKGKISMVCLTKAGGYVVKEVKDQNAAPHAEQQQNEGIVVLPTVIPKINIVDVDGVEKKLNQTDISMDKKEVISVEEPAVMAVDEPADVVVVLIDEPADVVVVPMGPIDIKKEIAFSILNMGEVLAKTIDYYSNDPDTQEIKDLIELSAKQSKSQKNTPDTKRKLITPTPPETETTKVEEEQVDTKPPQDDQKSHPSSSLVSPSSSSSASSLHEIESSPSKQQDNEAHLPAEPTTPVPPTDFGLEINNHTTTSNIANTTNSTPQPEHFISANNKPESFDYDEDFLDTKTEFTEETVVLDLKCETKSNSSCSDILSNEEVLLVEDSEVVESTTIEQQDANSVVFRTTEIVSKNNTVNKRMSLDEELFYHLEEVDKKVKYMNETCSEDEGGDDDDELDDENFDYDESVELESNNAQDERLFHPRTPAKIKSEVRSNRNVDLQEEIKQISSVIQDLVQTINVRNSSVPADVGGIDVVTHKSSLDNSDNCNADSEDGSQNSGSGGDVKTKLFHYNRSSNGTHNSGNIADRKSVGSNRRSVGCAANNQSLNSSIPVSVSRQKIATKTKGDVTMDVESINNSLVDSDMPDTPDLNNGSVNKSASSQRFRSKLPVKK